MHRHLRRSRANHYQIKCLDEQQQDKFSTMREQHHSNMILLDRELEETAKSYLSKLVQLTL